MDIRPPIWQLKSERCPDCGGQGELVFSKCPSCGNIILICAECETVFKIVGEKPGNRIGNTAEEIRCSKCNGAFYYEFSSATSEEIIAIGFDSSEYQ